VLAANKAEGRAADSGLLEAYALGLGEPIAISAEHGEGVADLFAQLRPMSSARRRGGDNEDGDPTLKLAIVGRPMRANRP